MKPLSLAALAKLVAGRAHGDATVGPDVVIDSRRTVAGALFVALPGDHVDGHRFVESAIADGAAAALVGPSWSTETSSAPVVVVDDPATALARLARGIIGTELADPHRDRPLTVTAITGSMGKTSTKDLLAHLLAGEAATVAPENSFNNEIGVPLTATRVDGSVGFLVSEMGARGVGHIAALCAITQPRIGVVLNVAHAHIGEFGDQETIARAKGELVESLPVDGWAVLNLDDPLVTAMATRTQARIAGFSLTATPSVGTELWLGADQIEADPWGRHSWDLLLSRDGTAPTVVARVALATAGRAQVTNALAAATAAVAAGLDPVLVAQRLDGAQVTSKWRMELHPCADGTMVVNDAYNANPDAVAGALGAVAQMARANDRRLGVVLGDMLELGDLAVTGHRSSGQAVAGAEAAWAVFVGAHATDQGDAAREAGMAAGAISEVTDAPAAEEAVRHHHRRGDVVLVKGSRGMRLERVADGLVARLGAVDGAEGGRA